MRFKIYEENIKLKTAETWKTLGFNNQDKGEPQVGNHNLSFEPRKRNTLTQYFFFFVLFSTYVTYTSDLYHLSPPLYLYHIQKPEEEDEEIRNLGCSSCLRYCYFNRYLSQQQFPDSLFISSGTYIYTYTRFFFIYLDMKKQ